MIVTFSLGDVKSCDSLPDATKDGIQKFVETNVGGDSFTLVPVMAVGGIGAAERLLEQKQLHNIKVHSLVKKYLYRIIKSYIYTFKSYYAEEDDYDVLSQIDRNLQDLWCEADDENIVNVGAGVRSIVRHVSPHTREGCTSYEGCSWIATLLEVSKITWLGDIVTVGNTLRRLTHNDKELYQEFHSRSKEYIVELFCSN